MYDQPVNPAPCLYLRYKQQNQWCVFCSRIRTDKLR